MERSVVMIQYTSNLNQLYIFYKIACRSWHTNDLLHGVLHWKCNGINNSNCKLLLISLLFWKKNNYTSPGALCCSVFASVCSFVWPASGKSFGQTSFFFNTHCTKKVFVTVFLALMKLKWNAHFWFSIQVTSISVMIACRSPLRHYYSYG